MDFLSYSSFQVWPLEVVQLSWAVGRAALVVLAIGIWVVCVAVDVDHIPICAGFGADDASALDGHNMDLSVSDRDYSVPLDALRSPVMPPAIGVRVQVFNSHICHTSMHPRLHTYIIIARTGVVCHKYLRTTLTHSRTAFGSAWI